MRTWRDLSFPGWPGLKPFHVDTLTNQRTRIVWHSHQWSHDPNFVTIRYINHFCCEIHCIQNIFVRRSNCILWISRATCVTQERYKALNRYPPRHLPEAVLGESIHVYFKGHHQPIMRNDGGVSERKVAGVVYHPLFKFNGYAKIIKSHFT